MDIGIDEVGRGCLAGPLVVGAVSLKSPIRGIKDSKLLSDSKRQSLAAEIYQTSEAASLGWVWPHEIDRLGLTQATATAIKRALNLLSKPINSITIDGNFNYLSDRPEASAIIKADNTIPSVSAASIIAKVARDNYMRSIARYFPSYGFDSHVGYGTKKHLEAIATNGSCCLHRLSFRPLTKETLNRL